MILEVNPEIYLWPSENLKWGCLAGAVHSIVPGAFVLLLCQIHPFLLGNHHINIFRIRVSLIVFSFLSVVTPYTSS